MNCLIVMPQSFTCDGLTWVAAGLAHISAVLKTLEGIKTVNLHLNCAPLDDEEQISHVLDVIKNEKIDAVLSGGTSMDLRGVRNVFFAAKQFSSKIVTITGGALVSGDPVPAMQALKYADYGIIGEGEETAAELCLALKNKAPTGHIKGLIIQAGQHHYLTPPRENIKDWTRIPWPDFEGFEQARPTTVQKIFKPVNTYRKFLSTSRGCPFNCTFCYNSSGILYRYRPLDDFFRELDWRLAKDPQFKLGISDDLLAASLPRLEAFCQGMKKYDFDDWRLQMRIPQVTAESLQMLRQAHCGTVMLGVENINDATLKSMNKKITRREIEQALGLLTDLGLKHWGGIILGDPAETYEAAMENVNWWKAHPQYNLALNFIVLYPGSALYKKAVAEGKIQDRVAFMENDLPVTNMSAMSDEEFEDLRQRVYDAVSSRLEEPGLAMAEPVVTVYDDHTFKAVRGRCRLCGRELDFDVPVGTTVLECSVCLGVNTLPSIQESVYNRDMAARNIRFLLEKYGRLAFWGIGGFFRIMMEPELLEHPGLHLIDARPGGEYGGKTIEPVATVDERGIAAIVIGTGRTRAQRDPFTEVKRLAEAKPGVKKVLSLVELSTVDLSAGPA